MAGVVTILLYVAIIIFVVKKVKKVKGVSSTAGISKAQAQENIWMPKKPDSPRPAASSVPKSKGVNKHMTRESQSDMLKDDRQHDWLAHQMAEERVAMRRMSDMFALKMEHQSSCEAELIRQFHQDHCDAGEVDTVLKG